MSKSKSSSRVLNSFSEIAHEMELYEPLKNLFEAMYGDIEIHLVDKKNEIRHFCDFFLVKDNLLIIAVQVKTTPLNGRKAFSELATAAKNALDYNFPLGNKFRHPSQFIWITTKGITANDSESLQFNYIENSSVKDKVDIWTKKELYDNFLEYYPDAFLQIKIDSLNKKVRENKELNNHIFAAHYLFRVFILHLVNSNIDKARDAIDGAISEIENQKNRSIYFFRSLKRFYQLWKEVLNFTTLSYIINKTKSEFIQTDEYERTWQECVFLMRLIKNEEIIKHIEDAYQKEYLCEYNFLCDYQYIYSQLQILFYEYANSPAGLSSKQICRTLLRFGFPPIGKIKERLEGMKKELEQENNCSVDSECSLCTATVLSCLVLANEDKSIISPIINWLEKLEDCKYCHLKKDSYFSDADSTEHAMHYAAQVLQAFVDCGDVKNTNKVLDHYFISDSLSHDGFYHEWMMHRNISNLETCAYIFSSFHRYLLTQNPSFQFDKRRQDFIKNAIVNLVEVLHLETTPQSKPWRLYATRENIQSLCLGLLVGAKETTINWLRELMQNIHYRAKRYKLIENISTSSIQHKSLMDSNVDRTTRFVEGWVSYWETIFYLEKDAPEVDSQGKKIRRTISQLNNEGYLPYYKNHNQK